MQWLIHTIKTFFSTQKTAAVAATGSIFLAVIMVGGLVLAPWASDAHTTDFTSPDYVAELLAGLDSTPEQFADDMIAGLLPVTLSATESAALVEDIADLLGGSDSAEGGAAVALADSMVRRLGLAAADADSVDDVMALLIAEVDPNGEITTTADLLAAIEVWAAETSPNVLRLLPGTGVGEAEAAGVLAGFGQMDFETVSRVLGGVSSTELLDIALPGIDGLTPLAVPGVRWEIDTASRSIAFWGDTDGLGGRNELLLSARWGDDPAPSLIAGVRVVDWRLSEAGFSGSLGDTALPDTTFLLADRRGIVTPDSVSAQTWARLTTDADAVATGPRGELLLAEGINALTTIQASTVPDSVSRVVGSPDTSGGRLGVRASLGPGFGVIDGSARPSRASLSIVVPGIDPPALPEWLRPSDDAPWSVTLETEGDRLDIGMEGGLDADLDGATRSFVAQFALSSDGDGASGQMVADLREPWPAPYGVDWLTFDDLTMTVDLDASSSSAAFVAELFVADRAATVTFDLLATDSATSVQMLAAIDRLGAADAARLLQAATGAPTPKDLPELTLDDVLIDIRAGAQPTVAIGGRATVAGQQADVLFSVESAGDASGIVIGMALDAWRLGDALPTLDDTLLGELEFPATALVLSDLDGRVEPTALSAPAQRFFADISGTGGRPLHLSPGLSIFSSLDLSGTPLETPLAALGYGDGVFPVVGTVPSSMIGLGGGSTGDAGGSSLSGLEFAVQLPEISGAGTPDWFLGGQLSVVVSGQPSIGLEGVMTVLIDGEELTFTVGAEFAKTPLGAELALFGELDTARPWVAPFGVEWLVVNDLVLDLSLDPVGTVGLGFAGDVVIGTKDIRAAIAVEVSAAGVPTNLVLQAESDEGVSTTDLLILQQQMAGAIGGAPLIDASDYPVLELRQIELRFAPQASERLGVDAGFVVAGDAFVSAGGGAPQRFAFLDFRLTDQGLFAVGELSAYSLGPLSWSDIELDLELSRNAQHFHFDGAVTLLGLEAELAIDVSTDSIIVAGREAIDELEALVDAMEVVLRDPGAAIGDVPMVFADAGVPLDPWMEDLFAQISELTEQGQAVGETAINVILNGGSVPLTTSPAGGNDLVCPVAAPLEDDGRCYTTPAIESSNGVPSGGSAKTCPASTPLSSGSRCYTVRPTTIKTCPLGYWSISSNRCENVFGKKKDKIVTNVPGLPDGGVAKTCGLLATHDGRCYVVRPGDISPALPVGGVDPVCEAWSPFEEDGRCYRVTPSQAERGLGVQGICKAYANVECTVEDLVNGSLLTAFFDRILTRLERW